MAKPATVNAVMKRRLTSLKDVFFSYTAGLFAVRADSRVHAVFLGVRMWKGLELGKQLPVQSGLMHR